MVSEIHEKMSCIRCQNYNVVVDEKIDKVNEVDNITSINEGCESDEEDIGGFASIAGCVQKLQSSEKQVGTPLEEDLGSWGHHFFTTSVPDAILQASAGEEVTFVYSNQIDGKLVPVESMGRPRTHGVVGNKNQSSSKENLRQKPMFSPQQPPSPSVSSNIGSVPASGKPLQRENLVSARNSLKGTLHVTLKPKLALKNQLPQKRLCSQTIDCDDFK
ncbi:DNA-dependent ATPase protein rad54 [Sarracenia purpurea var. burkii]